MSIQDIANYVRQTPGNTNPSVIKSMVKSEIGEYVEEASNETLRKLGIHKEQTKTWYIPEQVHVFELGDARFDSMPEPPAKIWVVFEGKEYECEAVYHENGFVVNYGNADGKITGEPFWIQYNRTNSRLRVYDVFGDPLADTAEYIFGIYIMEETTTPISDKYLPGVCLPVVELTTEPAINGYVTLTTDECSALNAAFEKKMPVVCQFGLMGMTVSIPLMYIVNPADSSGYIGASPFGDLYLTVGNAGNWTAMYRPEG